MIYKYNARYPFLNNLDEAFAYHMEHPEDFSEPVRVKTIGLMATDEQQQNMSSYPKLEGLYGNKSYRTTDIPIFFSKWNSIDFNHHYQSQLRLCDETLALLKVTKNGYGDAAETATLNQYRDLFFAYGYAFPVAEVLTYLRGSEPLLQETKGPVVQKKANGESVLIDLDEIIAQVGYTFHPIIRGEEVYLKWQEDLIRDESRFIVVLGSRQGGKSYVMALRALLSSFKGYRRDIMVCAYISETTEHIKKYLERLIENLPEGSFTPNKQKNWLINNATQSRIIFRSLSEDGHRIRGNTLHEIIMDECFLIDDETFDSVLLPTVSTTGGTICMISTPGEKNWFYAQVLAAKSDTPHYSSYQFTADDNPLLDPVMRDYVVKHKDNPTIQREYYCSFIDNTGSVFRPKKTIDASWLNDPDILKNSWFVLGYDPARKGKDRAAYACAMVHSGKVFIFRSGFIPEHLKDRWETQVPYIDEIRKTYPFHTVMDVTGVGDAVISIVKQTFDLNMAITYTAGDGETEDVNYPYGTTTAMNVGKSTLINNSMNFIDEGVAVFYQHTNLHLFTEIEGLVVGRTRLGLVNFTARGFDDITNAMMMCLYYIYRERLCYKTPEHGKIIIPPDNAYYLPEVSPKAQFSDSMF